MKTGSFIVIVVFLFASVNSGTESNAAFRNKECVFRYPPNFKISVKEHGKFIQLVSSTRSVYWEDVITIRKHNRKTEECDVPQSSSPVPGDQRTIAGHPAYAYSGEDAAMSRYIRRKGYFIEDDRSCWNFELIRKGRPYQKFDLSSEELKRLDKQSDQDSKKANFAFEMVLNSFAFRRE
jgi:hypothetical protein